MWTNAKLDDLCILVVDCPHSTPVWTDAGVIVLRSQNIRNGRLDLSESSFTDHVHFEQRIKRAQPKAGDLVITREAPMGEVCMIPEGLECCLGQRMVLLRPNEQEIDSRFLLYALQSPSVQHEIGVHEGTGSTVSNLRIPPLKALPIPQPPLPEQRAIAHILGTLDDKIELNRRLNQTLEEIARALFKSWFIDFDPVRAKAAGRQPEGMDAETAALFPDAFVDSELGEIPAGWATALLGDHVHHTTGVSYKSADLVPSSTALVTLKSFARGGGYREDGLKSFAGPFKPGQIVKPGDLIVARTDVTQAADVIGKPAIVLSTDKYEQLVASLDVLIVRPQSDHLSQQFVFQLLKTEHAQAHMYGHTSGTTVLHLNKVAVPSYAFVFPPAALAQRFQELAGALAHRSENTFSESRTLASFRDLLLPKLLSGELRVPDAERLVEQHV